MSGILKWLGDALKYLFDREGLRGLTVVVLLLLTVFGGIVAALTLTPLGGWVARLLGV